MYSYILFSCVFFCVTNIFFRTYVTVTVGTIDSNMRSNVTSLWDLLLDIPFISGGKTGAVDTAFERACIFSNLVNIVYYIIVFYLHLTLHSCHLQAIADPLVKAIVLRVNSPGGSASHTDMLWRYVVRAQEAGKPVVASVGTVAASGGLVSVCFFVLDLFASLSMSSSFMSRVLFLLSCSSLFTFTYLPLVI